MLYILECETKLLLDAELTLSSQWFLMSGNIGEIFDNSSGNHWGGHSEKGTLRHIWWELPPIQGFWKLICSQIDKIAGCDLPLESRELLWESLALGPMCQDTWGRETEKTRVIQVVWWSQNAGQYSFFNGWGAFCTKKH